MDTDHPDLSDVDMPDNTEQYLARAEEGGPLYDALADEGIREFAKGLLAFYDWASEDGSDDDEKVLAPPGD